MCLKTSNIILIDSLLCANIINILCGESIFRFFYELQGCLPVYPPAEDNYGVDSCDILCFPTNPVVVAITTSSGIIYHCIVLDSEEEDVFSKPFVSKFDIIPSFHLPSQSNG